MQTYLIHCKWLSKIIKKERRKKETLMQPWIIYSFYFPASTQGSKSKTKPWKMAIGPRPYLIESTTIYFLESSKFIFMSQHENKFTVMLHGITIQQHKRTSLRWICSSSHLTQLKFESFIHKFTNQFLDAQKMGMHLIISKLQLKLSTPTQYWTLPITASAKN